MQKGYSSNPYVVTGICNPNESRAQHYQIINVIKKV